MDEAKRMWMKLKSDSILKKLASFQNVTYQKEFNQIQYNLLVSIHSICSRYKELPNGDALRSLQALLSSLQYTL